MKVSYKCHNCGLENSWSAMGEIKDSLWSDGAISAFPPLVPRPSVWGTLSEVGSSLLNGKIRVVCRHCDTLNIIEL
ncbi:MAG TPA: hypothetical protein VK175_06410 [Leadbetterella sp.]|nr:hypothetical protein [Leadbetterella sp.]